MLDEQSTTASTCSPPSHPESVAARAVSGIAHPRGEPSPARGTPMSRLRRQVVACLRAPWMRPLSTRLARWYGGVATSLLYHRVTPGPVDPSVSRCSAFHPNQCLAVAEQRFDEQMRELAEHRPCIALTDAVSRLDDGTLAPGSVTITFDDGYRDNLQVALPILERYRLPATVFVTTGLIDRTALLWWNELEAIIEHSTRLQFEWQERRFRFAFADVPSRRQAFVRLAALFRRTGHDHQHALMHRLREASGVRYSYDDDVLDWNEVRELDRHPLITIAAHTVSHPVMRNITPEAAAREMRLSRRRLEDELGHPVPLFAYPFGGRAEVGPREFALCREQGFASAVTTRTGHWQRRHREHRFALPRIMIEYFDSLDDFRFKLSGLDVLLRQKGRRFVTV